jgi:hypothetical protein
MFVLLVPDLNLGPSTKEGEGDGHWCSSRFKICPFEGLPPTCQQLPFLCIALQAPKTRRDVVTYDFQGTFNERN